MIKLAVVVFFALFCHVAANVDASSFGLPEDTHKTAFGGMIAESTGLADEGQAQLQLVDVSPQDESQQSVNHVKEMFNNAFNSMKAQREEILAANPSSDSA